MNPNIILAGRAPDITNALMGGARAAGMTNAVQQQNALSQLYQQQGPGIMAGDPEARNALARLDPMAAYDMQTTDAASARADQQLELAVQEGKRAAANFARDQQKRAQAEQEIGIIKDLLPLYKQGMETGDMRPFNQMAAEHQITAEEFPTHVAVATGMLEELYKATQPAQADFQNVGGNIVDMNNPQSGVVDVPGMQADEGFRMATPEEAVQYGAQAGQFGPDGRFYPINPPSGTSLTTGPDGTVQFSQGPGVSGEPRKLTERQSQLALFGSMMDKTIPTIERLEEQFDPANLKDNAAARAGWAGNYFKSQDMQKYEAAGRAWAEGVLRLQTGAAATQPEIERVFQTYFAQPGDTPETVKYKRELRDLFAQSVGAASGGLIEPGQSSAEPSEPEPQGPAISPDQMTPEQRSVWEKYGGNGQ